MNAEQTQLVASEMTAVGFEAQMFGDFSVVVSLSNRSVNKLEVRTALSQKFEEISFNLTNTSQGILVQ